MTVIAALLDPDRGTLAMGADSQISMGGFKSSAEPKVIRRGRVLLAHAGQSLFRRFWHHVDGPEDGEPTLDWCWRQQDAFQAWCRVQGHGSEQDSLRSVALWGIVGARDGLFELSGSGDVVRTQERYAVAGAGATLAAGALHALVRVAPTLPAEAMVREACLAACTHAEGCSGPILVETLSW